MITIVNQHNHITPIYKPTVEMIIQHAIKGSDPVTIYAAMREHGVERFYPIFITYNGVADEIVGETYDYRQQWGEGKFRHQHMDLQIQNIIVVQDKQIVSKENDVGLRQKRFIWSRIDILVQSQSAG